MPALDAEHRGALAMLADLPDGATEATMTAHGLTSKLIVAMVRAGLVTMHSIDIRAGAYVVTRVQIIDAGRAALAEGRT